MKTVIILLAYLSAMCLVIVGGKVVGDFADNNGLGLIFTFLGGFVTTSLLMEYWYDR